MTQAFASLQSAPRNSIEVGGDGISGGSSMRYEDKKGRGIGGPISQSDWPQASTNITSMRGGPTGIGDDRITAFKTVEVRRREAEQAIQRTANIRKVGK